MAASTPAPLTAPFQGSLKTIYYDTLPLAAGVIAYASGLVSCWPSGYYGPAGQSPNPEAESAPIGRFYLSGNQSVSNVGGANGAVSANVQFFRARYLSLWNQDITNPVPITARERMCGLTDDHTACAAGSLLTAGGAGGVATDFGVVYDFEPKGTTVASSATGVWVELPYPSSVQEDDTGPGPAPAPGLPARAVWTSLAAYTATTPAGGVRTLVANTNGALAAQDGITIAIGDILLLPEGTTNISAATDAGLWQVTSLGGSTAKFAAIRPASWQTGANIPLGGIDVAPDGTLFGGTTWKSFATPKTSIIDTTAPALYPREVVQQVTLAGGTFAIVNVPLRSATKTAVLATYAGSGTPNAATLSYQAGVVTPGVLNTATVTVGSYKAAMVAQGTDTSVLNVAIINW